MLSAYLEGTVDIQGSNPGIKAIRKGKRSILKDTENVTTLSRYLAGKIPYHYRSSEKIGDDFVARHDAIEMVLSLFSQAPTTSKFQNSHCGEILSSVYLEEVLGYQRLYCKLTLTTAEDTNVHKMDGFFVNTNVTPFHYLFVEAKTSILPTEKTKFTGHRYALLRKMLESIGTYGRDDQRFDLTRIRDNLESHFDQEVARHIKGDLVPPGPANSSFLGIAVVNRVTIDQADDDFILTEKCDQQFDFQAIVVSDLATMAKDAYAYGAAISKAASP